MNSGAWLDALSPLAETFQMSFGSLIQLLGATLPSLLNMPLNDADYAAAPYAKDGPVYVAHEIVVGTDGRPRKCTIIRSSGVANIDALTCASFMKRAKYKPAQDDAEQPTVGVTRTQSAWSRVGMSFRPPELVDVSLRVKPVAGLKLPTTVGVFLTVDSFGQIIACNAGSASKAVMLHQVACDQAKRMGPLPIIRDDDGKPVLYVRNAAVSFDADPAISVPPMP